VFLHSYETTADLNAKAIDYEVRCFLVLGAWSSLYSTVMCDPLLPVQSPVGSGSGATVADRVCLVPILRAGLGMVRCDKLHCECCGVTWFDTCPCRC